jgi:hypothetical protein
MLDLAKRYNNNEKVFGKRRKVAECHMYIIGMLENGVAKRYVKFLFELGGQWRVKIQVEFSTISLIAAFARIVGYAIGSSMRKIVFVMIPLLVFILPPRNVNHITSYYI